MVSVTILLSFLLLPFLSHPFVSGEDKYFASFTEGIVYTRAEKGEKLSLNEQRKLYKPEQDSFGDLDQPVHIEGEGTGQSNSSTKGKKNPTISLGSTASAFIKQHVVYVQIQFTSWSNPSDVQNSICSGSIASSRHVITAAHCLVKSGYRISRLQVRTGGTTSGRIHTAKYGEVYKWYNPYTFQRDVALIWVHIQFTNYRSIRYPLRSFKMLSYTTAYAAGFGILGYSTTGRAVFPTELQQTKVRFSSFLTCRNTMLSNTVASILFAGTNTEFVCIRDLTYQFNSRLASNICGGDSGGPSYVISRGRFVQFGITSNVFGVCRSTNDLSFQMNMETYGPRIRAYIVDEKYSDWFRVYRG